MCTGSRWPLDAPRHDLGGRALTLQLAITTTASNIAFPISWEKKPQIERMVRSFKHNGVPLVHLWGTGEICSRSGSVRVAVPGIYFTQKVPDRQAGP